MGGRIITIVSLAVLLAGVSAAQAPAPTAVPNGLPAWAYNIPDKVQPAPIVLSGPVHVPDSKKEYDAAVASGNANPPDWFPDEHPPAPPSVTGVGGKPGMACGSCHLMSGQGHPESADLAGLPAAYIVRQMQYFKSGARKDDARMGPIAKDISDEDVRQAAEYFAAIKPIPFVKVVETRSPPKTYVATAGRHRQLSPEGGTEPIGHRIIETPVDPVRTTKRDPHSGFLAYVPPDSIENGEALVKSGGAGKTVACGTCHGAGLKGMGEVPRIAGMQPVYIARQLIMMQNGSSAGPAAAPMKSVVAKLSEDDIIAISAYLGSLPPN
jgi:cytochrome c553